MIDVCFTKRAGTITGVTFDGHAGQSSFGYDIVCAAVSALSQATLIGLVEIAKCDIRHEIDDDGYLALYVGEEPVGDAKIKADALFDTLYLALQSIQMDQSKYIKISEREV